MQETTAIGAHGFGSNHPNYLRFLGGSALQALAYTPVQIICVSPRERDQLAGDGVVNRS